MQQVTPTPYDPAPSRLRYRMQRWMLTPGIRLGLRFGIPFVLIFGVTAGYLADEGRRDQVALYVGDLKASIQERPEFMVGLLAIDGASSNLAEDIREVVPVSFPVSSFDLDLEHIRQIVVGLDPVKTASLRIRPGGVLQLDVTERAPVLVWRTHEGVVMLDKTGAYIDTLPSRASRAELPLIAGDGANEHVAEALALIAAIGPLGDRLRGFLRVGERRWDVILDRNQRIMLPPQNPVQTLERVIVLNEVQDMLERDVAVLDMRIAARPTLRMSAEAVKDWWRIREINGSGQ